MRNLFVFILLLLVSLPASAADKEKETAYERVMRTGILRCGYLVWPPFFEMDVNTGELKGFNRDVFERIFSLLDLDVEWVEVSLGYHVNDLQEGKVDAVCGDGPWIVSSIKQVDYGQPYYYAPVYLYIRADESRFEKPADLNKSDVRFVGIDGDVSVDLKNMHFPGAAMHTLTNLSDPSMMLMEVATGKADVVIVDALVATKFEENNPGRIKRLGDKPFAVYPGAFSVAKNEGELRRTLNGGIRAALDMGFIDMILDSYDPKHKNFMRVVKPYEEGR